MELTLNNMSLNIKFIDVNGVNIREEQRNDDSSLLFESLHSDNALSEDQIREILGRHSTNEIRLWSRLGHPLFHEAGHQSGEGARIVWKIVLENPEFRKLVVDPTYKDCSTTVTRANFQALQVFRVEVKSARRIEILVT